MIKITHCSRLGLYLASIKWPSSATIHYNSQGKIATNGETVSYSREEQFMGLRVMAVASSPHEAEIHAKSKLQKLGLRA